MLIKNIIGAILFIFLLGRLPLHAQQKQERQSHKVSCFRKKIDVLITHPTTGSKNGEIKVVLPADARKVKLVWGYGKGSLEGDHIRNLEADYYHLVITDLDRRCQAFVKDIQLKEQPGDE